MGQEIITALIALVSGGGAAVLIKLFMDYNKSKREASEKVTDDRIDTWKSISDKYEKRFELLESKLDLRDRNIEKLINYISELEKAVIRLDPEAELPKKPTLERE